MLYIASHSVEAVSAGKSEYQNGRLTLDLAYLSARITRDPRIVEAELHLVRPSDAVRVMNVLDVFDARWKLDGPTYPGFDGPPVSAGSGEVHVFRNFHIVAVARLPSGEGGVRPPRRSFIDFWGNGARLGPFGSAISLILDLTLDPTIEDQATADDAVTRALIAVSTEIGALGRSASKSTWSIKEVPASWEREDTEGLQRVAYVYQVQSHGPLLDTFLYGGPLAGLYPTLVDANEILDGALVCGTRGRQTTPTILHCNNPVIRRLVAEDGVTLSLCPIVLMEGHHKTTPEKERSANHAVQLLRFLKADGAVLTQEGGGMSIVDQMLTIEGAAANGIKCVAITYEMAGAEGLDRPLIYFTRSARNLISTGNRDELIELEAPTEVIGARHGTQVPTHASDWDAGRSQQQGGLVDSPVTRAESRETRRDGNADADLVGRVRVPLFTLYGAGAQVGAWKVRGFAP